jgi:hypothetical protein
VLLTTLENAFPRIVGRPYSKTSPITDDYNCVAWVSRDTDHWWEPCVDGAYWPRAVDPEDLPIDADLPEYLEVFGSLGFVECADATLEPGVEKIAIYAEGQRFDHVAYQRSDGEWSSKMGPYNDIRHESTDVLIGARPGGYPAVALYMARDREPHAVADSESGLLML